VYGQIDESDLTLELEGIDNPMVKEFKINNDEVFNEICPSNQCTIEYTHTFLDPPSPEINKYDIGYSIDFNLLDPITNKDLTPIQKKFVERFDVGITCFVKNVEDIFLYPY
ncbi:MAG: hypothetical protein ACM31M_04875, partial [Nitrososphaerota archaeon]